MNPSRFRVPEILTLLFLLLAIPAEAAVVVSSALNSETLHVILEIHSGEGNDPDDCFMDGTHTIESAKYINCRDGLKYIAKALAGGMLKMPAGQAVSVSAWIELHPRFLDLLAIDQESGNGDFDFERDIVANGHTIGLHNHYECNIAADDYSPPACENLDPGNWGQAWTSVNQRKEPTQDQWEVRAKTFQQVIGFHETLAAMTIDLFNAWGTSYRINESDDASREQTIEFLYDARYNHLTSHGLLTTDYSPNENPKCYLAESQNEPYNALVHLQPITHGTQPDMRLDYLDGRAILFGESYASPDVAKTVESVLQCMDEEQSSTQPYLFLMTVHLHNLIQTAHPEYTYQGLSDLQDFITDTEIKAAAYGKTIVYGLDLHEASPSTTTTTTSEKSCPAEQILVQGPLVTDNDSIQHLAMLRRLRDRVLSQTAAGQALITGYYRNSAEVNRILLAHPRLAQKAAALLLQSVSTICQPLLNGQKPECEPATYARADRILDEFISMASPTLQTFFKKARRYTRSLLAFQI